MPLGRGFRKIQYPSAAALVLPGFTPQMLSCGRLTSNTPDWTRNFLRFDNLVPSIITFKFSILSISSFARNSNASSVLRSGSYAVEISKLIMGHNIALINGTMHSRSAYPSVVPAKNHTNGYI
jgi:hypothetical protein